MAKLIKAGDFVGPGEERTAAHLEKMLPDEWVVICNKEVVHPRCVKEIDFIIVGIHCVFAVEEKSWNGAIHGNENGWVLNSGESFSSPISNVSGISRRLAGILRDRVPFLNKVNRPFVFPRVIMSADDVAVMVHDTRANEQVLHLSGSEEELIRRDEIQGSIISIEQHREGIIKSLTTLSDRPKIPKEVGDYKVLELLSSTGCTRSLLGEHRDGSKRILKLIQKPVTADKEKYLAKENALLREYKSLQKLAEKARTPKVDPYFSWDQEHFWVIPIHIPEGRTLRADHSDRAPREGIIDVCAEAFKALSEIHEMSIVHRSISPDRIFLNPEGRVLFTDFGIARIEGEETVSMDIEDLDSHDLYRAPECRVDLGLAERTSDVYSVGSSLLFWMSGLEPKEDYISAFMDEVLEELDESSKEVATEIINSCLIEDERKRPSAKDIHNRISLILDKYIKNTTTKSDELEEGIVIEDQYRVVRKLGEGATAITYLVEDQLAEDQYVLKKMKHPELALKLAKREFQMLKKLSHPNLPEVYDVRSPDKPFQLKMEYICGTALKDSMKQKKGDINFFRRLAFQLCDVLDYLASEELIHRDISPANILIPDEEYGNIKLIDFGLAAVASESTTAVGTPRYRAPEIERGGKWTCSSDLFSLAMILFELLTGRETYKIEDGIPKKNIQVVLKKEETDKFGAPLLEALLRASSPDPHNRFKNPKSFMKAIQDALMGREKEHVQGEEVINVFVDDLRGVYRNSKIGNADNRGLDTTFANDTYVTTLLDEELLPKVVEGQYKLVMLCGNPGDGKTAFLQKLKSALINSAASLVKEDYSGYEIKLGDITYAALYDASESHKQQTADDLLHSILKPLAGNNEPGNNYVAAIAINDGRLFDFFERNGQLRYGWIWDHIRQQIDKPRITNTKVLVVDLKHRCVIDKSAHGKSIVAKMLDKFLNQTKWQICEQCSARLECPMKWNVSSLLNGNLGVQVREKIQHLMLQVHLIREKRPTIRDLRSALSYLITHDLGCRDVHRELSEKKNPLGDPSRIYFMAAFDGSGSPDLILDSWKFLDPAVVPSPKLDRYLYFHRTPDQTQKLIDLFLNSEERPMIKTIIESLSPLWLTFMKRRYFFEAAPVNQMDESLELQESNALTVYRHLDEFIKIIINGPNKEVLENLLTGISRVDGVPPEASKEQLALRISSGGASNVAIVKRFPGNEFKLKIEIEDIPWVEYIPDQLTLTHISGSPKLVIGLDLFEILQRATDGYIAGPEEQGAIMEDIKVFKNQLLAKPSHEVAIIEGGRRLTNVAVREGKIVRED